MNSDEYYDYSDLEEEDASAPPDYASANYWENRYNETKENYDWYMEWPLFQPYLDKILQSKEKLLVFGCGNSTLSYDISRDYFQEIISTDISSSVINQMQIQYKDVNKLKWEQMDCRKLQFPSDYFDVVLDKGTIDALCCGSNADNDTWKTAQETFRVLKPNGYFIEITFGEPSERLSCLNHGKLNWTVLPPIVIEKNYSHAQRDRGIFVFLFQKMGFVNQ